MNEALQRICNDFINYREIFRDEFHWHNSLIYPVCSYIFLSRRQIPDPDRLHLCREILRENAGFFSYFRGNGELIFTAMLAADNDPGMRMELALRAYDNLKEYFASGSTLPLAAMIMSLYVTPDMYPAYAEEAAYIFQRMKAEHFFLTGSEDVSYAVLLALQVFDKGQIEEVYDWMMMEMEASWKDLKRIFPFHSNAMQSLSHVLYMCQGNREEKVDRVCDLYDSLLEEGIRYGKDYELVSLGILANLGIEKGQIILDLLEVDRFLQRQSGYGIFSVGKTGRYMHCVMILALYYMNQTSHLTSAFIISVLIDIERQQAAAAAAAA